MYVEEEKEICEVKKKGRKKRVYVEEEEEEEEEERRKKKKELLLGFSNRRSTYLLPCPSADPHIFSSTMRYVSLSLSVCLSFNCFFLQMLCKSFSFPPSFSLCLSLSLVQISLFFSFSPYVYMLCVCF